MQRLTTRGPATARAIANREDFKTSGALRSGRYWSGAGLLSGAEADLFYAAKPSYVVYSYATPIAWWTEENGWHKVGQKFSVTTSRHQGNLYLITVEPEEEPEDEDGFNAETFQQSEEH